MHRRLLAFFAVSVAVALVLIAASPVAHAQDGSGDDPQGAAYRGEVTYAEKCVRCHGPQGEGNGEMAGQMPVPLPNFTDPTFVDARSPNDLFDVIKNGRIENLMPNFSGSLSDDQIWDVVAYIWSLHISAEDVTAAQQAFGAACAACHGTDGLGDQQQEAPSLAAATWLDRTQTELVAAVESPDHPALDGISSAELALAAEAARQFSLGYTIREAIAEGDGALQVVVANGTTGTPGANMPVRLLVFDGQELVSSREAQTDSEGLADFGDLPTDSNWAFAADATYQDIPFSSDVRQFEPDASLLQIPLHIFEPGASADALTIDRAHWVVSIDNAQSIDVAELYAVSNTSDRVYMGEAAPDGGASRAFGFRVPAQATDISFEDGVIGGRYVREGDVVYDTLPVTPGQHQFLFRYRLPVVDGAVEIGHPIDYPVANLNLLMPDLGLDVSAQDWIESDPLNTPSGNYLNYIRTNLPAGEAPIARLAGMSGNTLSASNTGGQVIDPVATPGISGQPYAPLIVLALALVVGGVAFVLVWRRQHRVAASAPLQRQSVQDDLILQIAALDDAYDAGEIGEADYQQQRRLLKAQLATLMRGRGQ